MRIRKTIFGRTKIKPNTFIGGVSATLNTPALVAAKLGISVARIKSFNITGSNIEFAVVGGTYSLPSNCFVSDTSITYFDDREGLIITCVPGDNFRNATNLVYLKMQNLKNLGYRFCSGCINLEEVVLTSVTTPGWEDFEGCVKLSVIHNSFKLLNTIGNRTFRLCRNISSLDLQHVGNVTDVRVSSCFEGMTNLIYLNAPNLRSTVVSPTTTHLSSMIQDCPNLTTVILTNLNFIGQNFAKNATSLVSLDLTNVSKACLSSSFMGTVNLSNLVMPNIIELIGGTYLCFYNSKVSSVDFSRITNPSLIQNSTFDNTTGLVYLNLMCYNSILGSSALNNNILLNIKTGVNITVKTALETCNAGAPDADLQYAISSRGVIVNYIS